MEGYLLIMKDLCDLSYEDARAYTRSIARKFPLNLQRTGVYQSTVMALSQRKLPKELVVGFERKNRRETLSFLIDLAEKEMIDKKNFMASKKWEPSMIKCPLARKNITVYAYEKN